MIVSYRLVFKTEISNLRNKKMTLEARKEVDSKLTEKEKSQCRTQCGITTDPNPLLDLPIDLYTK